MRHTSAIALLLASASVTFAASSASADVDIEADLVREYQLPGDLDLSNARVQLGAGDSTMIVKTLGTSPEDAACGVVIADDDGARLIEYRYAGAPTQCVGSIPHPSGGFFLRGDNPAAEEDEVTGFTAYIGADDQEAWSVSDEMLVNAAAEPTGTGEFQGQYETAHPSMAYSPELDKLLAFTIGKLTIGQDEKFLSQAHVINADSGQLRISGQTFGLSGVGNVGGVTTRAGDGNYIIYYFSSGDRGAFFYNYNGRSDIEFFKPRGEDWDDRFVLRMIYENDLLHLLWTPTEGDSPETRITAVTDSGAELWSAIFEPEYTFANRVPVNLGPPVTMWVGDEHAAVLHQAEDMSLLLRVVDVNGDSPGVARLADATEYAPVAIVNASNGMLKLLAYDEMSRQLYEYEMTFVDVDDFDPDAGFMIPDGGIPGDVGIPADIGLKDVLEAAGCCATAAGPSRGDGMLGVLLGVVGLFLVRVRRRRD